MMSQTVTLGGHGNGPTSYAAHVETQTSKGKSSSQPISDEGLTYVPKGSSE